MFNNLTLILLKSTFSGYGMKNSITCRSLWEMHGDTIFSSNTMKFGIAFSRYYIQLISIMYISVIGKALMHIMKVKFQEDTLARMLLSLGASVS